MLKKLITVPIFAAVMLSLTAVVFAQSGTYDTTYDMTGGVYTQQTWNASAAPTFVVQLTPSIGVSGANIGEYLQKSGLFGYSDVDSAQVSSTAYSSSTLKGSSSGTYRIYFRDWSGFQNKGDIHISYSW